MKKKNVLIIILTALLLLSAALLGVSNVYRVDSVCVQATTVSQQAQEEVGELQARLEEAYCGENAFFATREVADEMIAKFPYFIITSFEKAYPNRIVIGIAEDAEVFALPSVDGTSYYILNENGTVLDVRTDYNNRVDGYANLLITGLEVVGEKGGVLSGDPLLQSAVDYCKALSARLEGIRRNILKIEVSNPTASLADSIFKIYTREGVIIYVQNPQSALQEKVEKAFNAYMGISSSQRLEGTIVVVDGENGVKAEYFHEQW